MDEIYQELEDMQELPEMFMVTSANVQAETATGTMIETNKIFTNRQIDILNEAFIHDGEWTANQLQYLVLLGAR